MCRRVCVRMCVYVGVGVGIPVPICVSGVHTPACVSVPVCLKETEAQGITEWKK